MAPALQVMSLGKSSKKNSKQGPISRGILYSHCVSPKALGNILHMTTS